MQTDPAPMMSAVVRFTIGCVPALGLECSCGWAWTFDTSRIAFKDVCYRSTTHLIRDHGVSDPGNEPKYDAAGFPIIPTVPFRQQTESVGATDD